MWQRAIVYVWVFAALLAAPVWAQPPTPGGSDTGVEPTRLIDRPEIRIFRVVLQPGATRRIHSHDDVQYHVWLPLEGTLQLSIGSDEPVSAEPGEAVFLERGTLHGFKNVGTTPAAVMEVFVNETGGNAAGDAVGLPFAALRPSNPTLRVDR